MFVTLYKEGLIYKDKRLVNWDPKLLTAISDLEVEQQEVNGKLWHFRYPLDDGTFDPEDPATFIMVATTRPETMLGDTAVAVHPDDERYRHLVGRQVVLPIVGRNITGRRRRAIPIRKRAQARSRSRPPTISTISRSASGTTCRRSTS